MKKPEILAPAGSLEALRTALRYGADAVYIGGEMYGLRAKAKNFPPEDMRKGIALAHEMGKKVYVTANITAHNRDMEGVEGYFRELKEMGPDALIISDPGVLMAAREICPEIDIHISTQANNVNAMAFRFWREQGAVRVVTARELSLKEIAEIDAQIPEDLEIETFVHGAMCISYSGRCLLSNYFTDATPIWGPAPTRAAGSIMSWRKRGRDFICQSRKTSGGLIFLTQRICA